MINSLQMSHLEDDHFANINYSKNIECIVPTAELMVNFRANGLKSQKVCYVYAEKLDFKGLIVSLRIRLYKNTKIFIISLSALFYSRISN